MNALLSDIFQLNLNKNIVYLKDIIILLSVYYFLMTFGYRFGFLFVEILVKLW